jgi:zinc transport system ATP-binding protein
VNRIAIRVDNLTVRYTAEPILSDISLTIPEQAFVAIVGPNGGGKSTLLRVLLGMLRPTSGRVQLFEKSPECIPCEDIGYVPQLKTLDRTFPAIAIELVVSGLRRRWPIWISSGERQTAMAALKQVGAAHLAEQSVATLSGGELQRVYLARILVRQPKLIVLDEPATGIDARGEHDLYHLLEADHTRRGTTILMVTHDWAAAQHHASHVLLLQRRLVAFGPSQEVLTDEHLNDAFGHLHHHHAQHETAHA